MANTNISPIEGDEELTLVIDLEEFFHSGASHPEPDPGVVIYYKLKIDGQPFKTKHRHLSGSKILQLADLFPDFFELFQLSRIHGLIKEVEVKPDEIIDFGCFGVEQFTTKPITYCFWIDRKDYHTNQKKLTVRSILVDYAQVDPADKTLAQKKDGGFHEYKNLDEEIPLKDCPRFTLLDNTPTTVS